MYEDDPDRRLPQRSGEPEDAPLSPVATDKTAENIERIAATVERIAVDGIALAKQYVEAKSENDARQIESEDKQHHRAVVALIVLVVALFVFCTIAVFKGQGELAKMVLTSGLGAAAGAGALSALGRRRRGGSGGD